MKKKIISYADQVRNIKKRFPRATWDSIERKDMLDELSKLKDHQEEFRQANGMSDDQQQQQPEQQEQPQMQHGGGWDSWEDTSKHSMALGGKYLYPNFMNRDPWHMRNYAEGGGNPDDYLNPADEANVSNVVGNSYDNTGTTKGGSYQPLSASIVPSAIAAGASALGDIGSLIAAKQNLKRNRVSFPSVVPTYINLAYQREAIQRAGANTTNIALANSRNASNPSNAYANQVGAVTEVGRNVGEGLAKSYLDESVQNAGISNQTSQTNAQLKMYEAMQNARAREMYGQQRMALINSLGETVPRAMADYRAQANAVNTINNMGKDYGVAQFIPNYENSWQAFVRSLIGGKTSIRPKYSQYINSQQ